MTTPTKTDRDLWADDAPMNLFVWSIIQGQRAEAVAEGLKAMAAVWFNDYTDETDLPSWFIDAIDYLDTQLDLDIPRPDEEDDDDD